MAHSAALLPLPASSSSPFSSLRQKTAATAAAAGQRGPSVYLHERRQLIHGLVAAGVGLVLVAPEDARAAKRRPPPPVTEPGEEKADPNVSGVLAKVLASKKRKEAMKEAVAKLREKGKRIDEPPQ
ncbi:uncharacterized protein LOC122049302 [Zingiber officinale]|nr:uncharacterized protein LOC122049302 [Zingiber officinale]